MKRILVLATGLLLNGSMAGAGDLGLLKIETFGGAGPHVICFDIEDTRHVRTSWADSEQKTHFQNVNFYTQGGDPVCQTTLEVEAGIIHLCDRVHWISSDALTKIQGKDRILGVVQELSANEGRAKNVGQFTLLQNMACIQD